MPAVLVEGDPTSTDATPHADPLLSPHPGTPPATPDDDANDPFADHIDVLPHGDLEDDDDASLRLAERSARLADALRRPLADLHYASRPPDAPDEHDAYTSDDSTGRCFTARLAWTHFLEKLDDTLKSLAPADRTRLMILSKDHAPFGLTAAEASSQISASRLAIPVNDATLPPTTLVAVRGGHPPTVSSAPPPPYVSDEKPPRHDTPPPFQRFLHPCGTLRTMDHYAPCVHQGLCLL